MRGEHHLLAGAQRRVLRQRLGGEGVEAGAGEVAVIDQLQQRVLVDQATARGVDHVGAFLHLRQLLGAEDVGGFLGARDVQGDDVGPGQQGVEVHQRDGTLGGGVRRQEGVVGGDLHADAARLACHGATDAAEADHAEALALEFEAGEAALRPLAGLHAGVGGRHVAGQREQQGQRLLGGGQRVAVRRIHHRDAAVGGGFDVDGVDTGAGTTDHAQVRGMDEGLGRHLGGRTDDQHVDVGQGARQRAGVFDGVDGLDRPAGVAEQGQTIFVDTVASKNAHGALRG